MKHIPAILLITFRPIFLWLGECYISYWFFMGSVSTHLRSQNFFPINLRWLCKKSSSISHLKTKRLATHTHTHTHTHTASLEISIALTIIVSVLQRVGSVLLPPEWNMSSLLRLISVLKMLINLLSILFREFKYCDDCPQLCMPLSKCHWNFKAVNVAWGLLTSCALNTNIDDQQGRQMNE